ncbi:MAG TPA: YeeE/YedE family protein [Mogibacterium sp.]|nr:YeeE/YedE family protein [Mogibacterium sp.]
MVIFSGFIIGTILGYMLKRSRICFMGTIRDVYLEKRSYNLALVALTIFSEAIVYNLSVIAGLVPDGFISCFSPVAVSIGSLMFGFGAVMAGGCLTMTLVKMGDGRLTGLISFTTFVIVGYFFSAGGGRFLAGKLRHTYELFDSALIADSRIRLILSAVAALLAYTTIWQHNKKRKSRNNFYYSKVSAEIWFILIGVLFGVTFPISQHFGRAGGFAITTPILSYPYTLFRPEQIVGGCNISDQRFGFGSMLVLGIVFGSFITSVISREFNFVIPRRKQAVKTIIGSAMMAFGAIVAGGCMVSNGLVGTSQFYIRSWIGLIFISMGGWLAAYIFFIEKNKTRQYRK